MSVLMCMNGVSSFAAEEERRIEEKKRSSLDASSSRIVKEYQRVIFEYGGWINYRFINFVDNDNDSATKDSFKDTYSFDGRFWAKATLKPPQDASFINEHSVYVRIKDLYIMRDGDTSVERYDHDGPHLDYANLLLDFTPYRLEAGRRYFNIGRGISYSNVNDGVQINYFKPGLNIGAMYAHTLPHEDNIDTSVPGFDKESDRSFYGLGLGYAGIKNHQLYSYVLIQRDDSNELPNDPGQQFVYNSEYFGLGALGKISKNLNYYAELIKEFGNSRVFGTSEKTDVDAYAALLGLEKRWPSNSNPKLMFEYAFGSGDKDRISVTDTLGGNLTGDDNNFLYFGYIPTGIALSPRLSNLHMYHLGLEAKPLQKISFLKNFLLIFDYFYFRKHQKEGGISDLDATEPDSDVGHEVDITLDWQMLSDLNVSLEYGHFMPGSAYPDEADSSEDYVSLSFTHTF